GVTDRVLGLMNIPAAPIPLQDEIRATENVDVARTVGVAIAGANTALETRFDPAGPSLRSRLVELPKNDPMDSPVTLPDIVDFIRSSTRGAAGLSGPDLTFIGDR